MKAKIIYLIIITFHIYKIYGCEIKEVRPHTITPGDSITLTIDFSTQGCGQVTNVIIFSFNYRDSIHAISVNEINDSIVTARFFIAETVNVGPAAIVTEIYNGSNFNYYQTEQGIINIGTSLVQKPKICMVTVDSTNKNMVIWEKPNDYIIDSIYIYKETSSTNNYLKIGTKSVDDGNYFVDTESVPDQNSNSYKISFIDSLGFESPLSDYHKTIHLTMNLGINGACNLIWDKYTGFTYSTYNVFKGSTIDGMLKIAELPANLFTYTDLAPNLGGTYYAIEITNPNGCSIDDLKSAATDYISTRSNIIYLEPTNAVEQNQFNGEVSIYPNPAKNELNVFLQSNDQIFGIELLNLTGNCVYQNCADRGNSFKLKVSEFPKGIYILKIETKIGKISEQVVIQ